MTIDSSSFSGWCDSNPNILPYLTIFSSCCPDIPDSRHLPFSERRSFIHTQVLTELHQFLNSLTDRFNNILTQIESSQHFTIAVPPAIYTSPNDNMLCRIYGHVQVLVFDGRTSVLTHESFSIEKHKADTFNLISLFQSQIMPADTTVTVSPAFFSLRSPVIPATISSSLTRTTSYLTLLEQQVFYLPAPIWRSDFLLFLRSLLKEIELDFVPGTGYYLPSPSEVSLASCLVTTDSPVKRKLQLFESTPIDKLRSLMCQTVEEVLRPNIKDLNKHDRVLARFVLYRVIFDICYCRQRFWGEPDRKMIAKIAQLSEVPSSCFKLPESLLARPLVPNESIRKYIWNDSGFLEAAKILGTALFATNPLDALFTVYDSLTEIKRTANRNSEQNSGLIDEGTLSFDDTFCMFFVVFLASDLVDLPGLKQFVLVGAPEQLSSTFEYSKTMLEALVMHIEQIEIELLVNGGY
jgi:hypothetical protein